MSDTNDGGFTLFLLMLDAKFGICEFDFLIFDLTRQVIESESNVSVEAT